MNPKITDEALADLPLHHGRADLLEEIMRTPTLDDRPIRAERPRRRTTWLVPVAAASVVAALAVGSAWWATGGSGGDGADSGVASQPTGADVRDRVVLDAPGWVVAAAYADGQSGEMTYEKGRDRFDVSWYPADQYDSYVEDRRHVVEPPADGEPVTVLELGAQMWAYSATDHTAIREVEGGRWFELRGSGMDEAGYRALLTSLRFVDQAEFDALLPGSFVTGSERSATIDEILDGIADVAHPLLPAGVARSSIDSDQSDDYQLGAEVAGAVACAWLDEYADATRAGDERRAQRAAGVLTSAQDWPVLDDMNARGDYPEVIWEYADQVVAGKVPEGYAGGLGCDR
ncbi:hypothetical protein [Nocardioides sp. YIM 152315]|uniref:hypothetical protein n=1 Tax=Nocardioides sp. YIM 152315 TaxID=3031760 RepID=UPI0023DAEF44|nr:hypothetical protein [Nocardioides sp. YIM 152315]MDF1605095.1 hypothetical protein [Nocardioides sp. YIM 152315]